MDFGEIERIIGSLSASTFECPHCGQVMDGSDPDIPVVSYWGETHAVTCVHCGEGFVVREHVMRSYSAALDLEALDA